MSPFIEEIDAWLTEVSTGASLVEADKVVDRLLDLRQRAVTNEELEALLIVASDGELTPIPAC